jgi:hypothetical protein
MQVAVDFLVGSLSETAVRVILARADVPGFAWTGTVVCSPALALVRALGRDLDGRCPGFR